MVEWQRDKHGLAAAPLRAALIVAALGAGGLTGQEVTVGLQDAYQRAQELAVAGAPEEEQRDAYARAWSSYARLDPSSDAAREWFAAAVYSAIRAGEAARVAALLQQRVDAGDVDAATVEWLLRAHLAAGAADPALRAVRRHIDAHGDLVHRVLVEHGGLAGLGAAAVAGGWLRRGDTDAAMWLFEFAVESSQRHAFDLANLALANRHIGRIEDAESLYREALEAAPDDAILWNDWALFLKGTGRPAEAAEALERSRQCEQPPDTGPATTNLLLLALGRGEGVGPAVGQMAVVLAKRPAAALARRALLQGVAADWHRGLGAARR